MHCSGSMLFRVTFTKCTVNIIFYNEHSSLTMWLFLMSVNTHSFTFSQKRIPHVCFDKENCKCIPLFPLEPGYHSRYSDWLQAGQPRSQSSSPGRVKNFLFSTASRLPPGPTQSPIQWIPGVKRPGREADHSQPVLMSRKRGSVYPLPHMP
jgi:hypothetical protein